jgi:hypothetical protein
MRECWLQHGAASVQIGVTGRSRHQQERSFMTNLDEDAFLSTVVCDYAWNFRTMLSDI